jgi:hypothetical protein
MPSAMAAMAMIDGVDEALHDGRDGQELADIGPLDLPTAKARAEARQQ